MGIPDSSDEVGKRGTKKGRPLGAPAAAALCFAATILLYHIPLGSSMAADALHACLAGVAALVCLALWAGREEAGKDAPSACPAQAGRAREAKSAHAGKACAKAAHAEESDTVEETCTGADEGHPKPPRGLPAGPIALLCLAGALVSVAVPLATSGTAGAGAQAAPASPQGFLALLAVLAASCLGTAVWEEIAFRRLAMEAVAGALEERPHRRLLAACICSAVFATLHLPEMGEALPTALRGVQVALFALAMVGLVEQTGRLAPAVAAHAVYDVICFAPAVLGTSGSAWEIPASSLMTLETSMLGMLASLLFLAPAAALGVRRLLAAR